MSEKFNISLFVAMNDAKSAGRGAYISRCVCDGHEDKNPSFVVKHNPNSMFGYQYQCLSGMCTSKEITDALIKQGVINTGKGTGKPYSPVPLEFKGDPLDDYYEYTDSDGTAIGYVARYKTQSGKNTIPFFGKPDEDWKFWKCGINKFYDPNKKPVYNLYNALKSNEVWVVEGEKAANSLNKIKGICAVTNLGGCKVVDKADWSFLKGKNVIIWRDFDDAGAGHTYKLSKILKKLDICFQLVDTSKIANKVLENKGE